MTNLKPYDIQPGESAKAYEAFAVYRDDGPDRSLVKAGQKLGKNTTTLSQWSTRFAWVERARAFDEEVARRSAVASVDAHAAAKARHAEIAVTLQNWGLDVLNALPVEAGKPAEGISAVVRGVQMERRACDIPDRLDVTSGGKPITPVVREVVVEKARRADDDPGE